MATMKPTTYTYTYTDATNIVFSSEENVFINININNNNYSISNTTMYDNLTGFGLAADDEDDYIFDRTDVRIIFITLYSIVFSCCFLGNLLVIIVVALSRRLRSITNFFLANLAVADFCVGIFCVYQNLLIYLIPTWVLGDFLCKMYQFVHSLSYTASIFILVVICTERYFAIIHPITCKQILTPTRLRMVIGAVWITSAVYSAPKFLWVQTVVNTMRDGTTETICVTHRQKYNSKVFDIINFVLLYVVPLAVMTFLYTRIALGLWQSSRELEKHLQASAQSHQLQHHKQYHQQYYHHSCSHACQQQSISSGSSSSHNHAHAHTHAIAHVSHSQSHRDSQCHRDTHSHSQSNSAHHNTPVNTYGRYKAQHPYSAKSTLEYKSPRALTGGAMSLNHPNSTQNVLRARRGVIRMLIVIVLMFAMCNLPFHARKMWQYWSSGYRGSSDFSTLFTPLTFLITYFNSGINPLLYAFLSRNFRRGMREILLCSLRPSSARRPPSHKFYNTTPRDGLYMDGLLNRQASTRSTLKANSTTITILQNLNSISDSYSNDV